MGTTDNSAVKVRLLKEMINLNKLKGAINDAEFQIQYNKLQKEIKRLNMQIDLEKAANDAMESERHQ